MSERTHDLNTMTLEQLGKLSEEETRAALEKLRWPDGPSCPHCSASNVVRINGESPSVRTGLFRCKKCRKQFTVTVGTIFEDSHISLHKWLLGIGLMCSSKKGISSLQLKRNLGLGSYQTAWFMAHRIRHAMKNGPLASLLNGTIEVDETYIGGKTRLGKRGRGSERKTPVVALVERGGRIRTNPVERVSAKALKGAIREHVCKDSRIVTDDLVSYKGIGKEFTGGHASVLHGLGEHVRGDVHVNSAESFFALLKRGVHGTFHHVSKTHLARYCQEFAFRWDHRKTSDAVRTVAAILGGEGKRLTYRNARSTMTM